MEAFRLEHVSFRYPSATEPAVKDLSFTVEQGELLLICGESGCGKTTLLKLLKPEIAPAGERSGRICFEGRDLDTLPRRVSGASIGYVGQNPESQIVTDTVWHELAFGLENLGADRETVRRRSAEAASFFGLADRYRRPAEQLSGGQKQLLNLASVMALNPRVLLLDEPTSRLDPIAAAAFTDMLRRLRRELGITILVAEHRTEDLYAEADRVLVLERGGVSVLDEPRRTARFLMRGVREGTEPCHPMAHGLPAAARIFGRIDLTGPCPLTVGEGRRRLQNISVAEPTAAPVPPPPRASGRTAVRLRDLWFRYEKNGADVLRGAALECFEGEVFALLGGNGSGKTTLLNAAAGLLRPYRGSIEVAGRKLGPKSAGDLYRGGLAYVPQDPAVLFLAMTVEEDWLRTAGGDNEVRRRRVAEIAERLGVARLGSRHPLDLSGGELQAAALAKALLQEPKVLLLDEPTKGIDAAAKRRMGRLLRDLAGEGRTVLLVTHDLEFAAEYADRCGLFFDGEVLSAEPTGPFFVGNRLYTTPARRMAEDRFPDAVTCDDVVRRILGR